MKISLLPTSRSRPAALLFLLAGLSFANLPGASREEADSPSGTLLVRIAEGVDAEALAESMGARYGGPVEGVGGFHRFVYEQPLQSRPDGASFLSGQLQRLETRPEIRFVEKERMLRRYPRRFEPRDPLFPDQWHHENLGQGGGIPHADANVRPAWDAGLFGAGVTIGVVDTGIQFDHPDLFPNYLSPYGYDFLSGDSDPSPSEESDRHGTAVAGISLAAANDRDGLGIAPSASLIPIRLIPDRNLVTTTGGSYSSSTEAEALSYRDDIVDIYNNSWGPGDGRYAAMPGVVEAALEENVREGRNGRGTIYVWAAGNGGLEDDNSNYDGYNASPYTISVGAIGDNDILASYSEPGANLLVTAPSLGTGQGIVTTDNTGTSGYSDGDTTDNFSGTSAAAPMVSGLVALLLEARPDLGWRDVQQILARTAEPVDLRGGTWTQNGAGLWTSHEYGFGRIDAEAALRVAGSWPLLPAMETRTFRRVPDLPIPDNGQAVADTVEVPSDLDVQFARVRLQADHNDWGHLRVELVSPSGTRSVLAESHFNGNGAGQPGEWTYLSTRYLGESSLGEWTLEVSDERAGTAGTLNEWSLLLMGTLPTGEKGLPPVTGELTVEAVTYPVTVDLNGQVVDPDGDPVELISVQPPRGGRLTDTGEGIFHYERGAAFDGRDFFSALFSDGKGGVVRRLVEIVDPSPVGQNDTFPVLANSVRTLPVLENDRDLDGDPLRLTGIEDGNTGEAVISGDESTILYSAPSGFTGVRRIQYFFTDDSDGSSSAWATVVVQEEPDIALEFDGLDDFLLLPAEDGPAMEEAFTLEAVIHPRDWGEHVTGFGRIYDRGYVIFFLNGFDHAFYNDRSLVAFFILENGTEVAANSVEDVLVLNEDQHVALTFDHTAGASSVRMFIDGEEVALSYPSDQGLLGGAPGRPLAPMTTQPLYMGENPRGARAFKGRISGFRIWEQARSPAQVAAAATGLEGGDTPAIKFPLDRQLGSEVPSTGTLTVSAFLNGPQRVPGQAPWSELESRYRLLRDAGSGWWEERTFGWIFGDRYPWIYADSVGWAFSGHADPETGYLLYPAGNNWGWLATTPGLYPWFHRALSGDWLWHVEGTANPSWWYSFSAEDYFISGDSLPDN